MNGRKYTAEEIKKLEEEIRAQTVMQEDKKESLSPNLERVPHYKKMRELVLIDMDNDDAEIAAINTPLSSNDDEELTAINTPLPSSNLKKRKTGGSPPPEGENKHHKTNDEQFNPNQPINFTIGTTAADTPSPKAQRKTSMGIATQSPKGNNSFANSRNSVFGPTVNALAFSIQNLLGNQGNNEERKSPTHK